VARPPSASRMVVAIPPRPRCECADFARPRGGWLPFALAPQESGGPEDAGKGGEAALGLAASAPISPGLAEDGRRSPWPRRSPEVPRMPEKVARPPPASRGGTRFRPGLAASAPISPRPRGGWSPFALAPQDSGGPEDAGKGGEAALGLAEDGHRSPRPRRIPERPEVPRIPDYHTT